MTTFRQPRKSNTLSDEELSNRIKYIQKIAPSLNNVPFKKIIKYTTGHNLIELDQTKLEDWKVYNTLEKVGKAFENDAKGVITLSAPRINEVGKQLAKNVAADISKGDLSAKFFTTGYPNVEIKQKNHYTTYLSVKATADNWESVYRALYYTTGKNIITDARHMLICFNVKKIEKDTWKVIEYLIIDLFNVALDFKAEFNVGNNNLYPTKQTRKLKPSINDWL